MRKSSNTAILIFANSSKEELLHKPVLQSQSLFETLTQEVLTKVRRTGISYIHFTEKEQIGSSFGDRFIHAIETVFAKGYDSIITIGNDTPQLKTSHLIKAKKALERGNTVLGPSLDGGFYLMGLHRSNFDPETFQRLPWQRFGLLRSISSFLENKNGSVIQLDTLVDIDHQEDVKRIASLYTSVSKKLRRVLTRVLQTKKDISTTVLVTYIENYCSVFFNKGSPSLLFHTI